MPNKLGGPVVAASHIENGLAAVGTVGGEEGEVVRLAVRPPVLFKEVAIPQLCLTLGADKVLGVPHLSQGRDHLRQEIQPVSPTFFPTFGGGFAVSHLSYHRLLAGGTVALGGRLDPLSAQVRLQQPQHAVQ